MIYFNSWKYVLFLVAVVVVYWRLPRRGQNWLLLGASAIFYASWSFKFLFLLLGSALAMFFAGLALERSHATETTPARRKQILLLAVATNLTILAVFKYLNFFLESLDAILAHFGASTVHSGLHLLLPLGISFYTFQGIGYIVDVYRGTVAPTRSLPTFVLFKLFFPQLIAGPIERAGHLIPQLEGERTFRFDQFMRGAELIVWGLVQKVVVADNIGYFVRYIVHNRDPSTLLAITGSFGFGVQLFADFSGYTDIARGSAKLLGIDLVKNFDLPYLSRNPAEFWRRWHVSLSSFVRDYIYLPLGGSRGSAPHTAFNVLASWTLMGLWHGAAWHFVLWGTYHGILVLVHRLIAGRDAVEKGRSLPSRVVTYVFINLGWLLFVTNRLSVLRSYFQSEAIHRSVADLRICGALALIFFIYALPLLAGLILRCLHDRPTIRLNSWRIVYFTACLLTLFLFGEARNDFVYFQF